VNLSAVLVNWRKLSVPPASTSSFYSPDAVLVACSHPVNSARAIGVLSCTFAGLSRLSSITLAGYVLCVRNDGYPASLLVRRLHERVLDRNATARGLFRVVDEF
jgi:hypothetical protein